MDKPKKITKEMLESDFVKEFNDKISINDANAKFFPLKIITLDDLDPTIRNKIMNGTGTYVYDDTDLRKRIVILEGSSFIKGTDKITQADLDGQLSTDMINIVAAADALNTFDKRLTNDETIFNDKANSVDVEANYRKKSDPILETDFDNALGIKFSTAYNKALNSRQATDKITTNDMDDSLSSDINKAIETANNVRSKTDPILLTDLSSDLQTSMAKLGNSVSTIDFNAAMNDIYANYLKSADLAAQMKSMQASLETIYRKIEVPITKADLEKALTDVIDKITTPFTNTASVPANGTQQVAVDPKAIIMGVILSDTVKGSYTISATGVTITNTSTNPITATVFGMIKTV